MALDTDAAWCAGFFDGEGSTSILKAQRDKYSYIRMSIAQKDPEVLLKFKALVSRGSIYKAKTRNIYSWDCYKQDQVIHVLSLLWPYLGTKKKLQAQICLDIVGASL